MTNALWYFGRGFGVSALVLFTLTLLLGIATRSGRPLPGLPRFAVTTVHRTTSLSALLFLALHVSTLLIDPYAQLRLIDIVVPFVGSYRPVWQGFGTVAADLVVILIVSSLLRHRLGLRVWRVLHWAAYLCWPAAIGHALGNGTDRAAAWLLSIVAACVVLVIGALGWRLASPTFAPEVLPERVLPPRDLAGLQ
ncbi:MAG: ferric reductase-like transmembrane domain-containing protein [Actinomycetota bacterium]|nr:ferric reductase-like transmembrane domain-containing protein [Actinomycetota bacterium]